jgi:hypothetical protein
VTSKSRDGVDAPSESSALCISAVLSARTARDKRTNAGHHVGLELAHATVIENGDATVVSERANCPGEDPH